MSDRIRQGEAGSQLQLELGGRPMTVAIRDCKVCLGGEFAGNVDLLLDCADAAAEAQLASHLELLIPGDSVGLSVLGSGAEEGGLAFSFHSEVLSDSGDFPESVELLCGGEQLAKLPCRLWGSVPLDPTRFKDPSEFLGAPSVSSLGGFRTRSRRMPVLSTLGFGLIGLGSLLAAEAYRAVGLDHSSPGLVGGGLLALLGGILLGVMLWPHRYIRVDPTSGTIAEVRGRDLPWHSKVLEEVRHDLSDFSHVRIVERFVPSTSADSDDRELWMVMLEGPIRWQDEYGVVHIRSDWLRVDDFASDVAARRFAAQLAVATGLRILDTSDTGM